MAKLVLTVIGDDRSGLVDALSGVIAEHGGNWDRSHMTELAGKFAGIVLVDVPNGRTDDLLAALEPLEVDGVLDITVEVATAGPAAAPTRRLTVDLVGQDHPGIVHDISRALAARNVNIIDLQTSVTSAPMAGGTLFEAHATIELPAGMDADELRSSLEALADELMVDLDVVDGSDVGRGRS